MKACDVFLEVRILKLRVCCKGYTRFVVSFDVNENQGRILVDTVICEDTNRIIKNRLDCYY